MDFREKETDDTKTMLHTVWSQISVHIPLFSSWMDFSLFPPQVCLTLMDMSRRKRGREDVSICAAVWEFSTAASAQEKGWVFFYIQTIQRKHSDEAFLWGKE